MNTDDTIIRVYDLPYLAVHAIGGFLGTNETMALYVFSIQQKQELERRLAILNACSQDKANMQVYKATYFAEVAAELLQNLPPLTNATICNIMNQLAQYSNPDVLILMNSEFWNVALFPDNLSHVNYIKCIADYSSVVTIPGQKLFARRGLKEVGHVRQNRLILKDMRRRFIQCVYDEPDKHLITMYQLITGSNIDCSVDYKIYKREHFPNCFEDPFQLFKRICTNPRMKVSALLNLMVFAYRSHFVNKNAYLRAHKPERRKILADALTLEKNAMTIIFTNLIYRLTLSGLFYKLMRMPGFNDGIARTIIIVTNEFVNYSPDRHVRDALETALALAPIYAPVQAH